MALTRTDRVGKRRTPLTVRARRRIKASVQTALNSQAAEKLRNWSRGIVIVLVVIIIVALVIYYLYKDAIKTFFGEPDMEPHIGHAFVMSWANSIGMIGEGMFMESDTPFPFKIVCLTGLSGTVLVVAFLLQG